MHGSAIIWLMLSKPSTTKSKRDPRTWQRAKARVAQELEESAKMGEHDLTRIAVPQAIKDRMRENISQPYKVTYQPEYAFMAYELLCDTRHPWTLGGITAVIGCHERTIYKWIADHEDFARAILAGKKVQESQLGAILMQGFKYSKSVEFILSNLHDWTAKREDTHKLIDLNKEIAEREEFSRSHRVRKKVDWRAGEVIEVKPEPKSKGEAAQTTTEPTPAQLPPATKKIV